MMTTPVQAVDLLDSVELSPVSAPVSLEQRLTEAYAKASVSAEQQQAALTRAANNPEVTSDPARLYQLQVELSNHVLKMNLTSTLARKAVGCVETLIKAQ